MKDSSTSSKNVLQTRLDSITNTIREDQNPDIGLLGGRTGNILYYAYLSRFYNDHNIMDDALEIINTCIDYMNTDKEEYSHIYSYGGGLTGFGWTVAHLIKEGFLSNETEEILEAIDERIIQFLNKDFDNNLYDPLHGYVGKGIYFLERLPNPIAIEGLTSIVRVLQKDAIRFDEYISWPNTQPDMPKDGLRCDYGIAHGVSGIIMLLCQIYKAGIMRDKVFELIESSTNWLLLHKSHETAGNEFYFPDFVTYYNNNTSHIIKNTDRLGWCYGDLSVCSTILQAARIVGKPNWINEINDVIKKHLGKTPEKSNIFKEDGRLDTSFCHGALGIAYMYDKLYDNLQERSIHITANYWQSVALREVDKCLINKDLTSVYNNRVQDCGLLYGYSGIGLTIMGLSDKSFKSWERCLLIY